MQGNLSQDHLPGIIRTLGRARETGILSLSQDYINKQIYFGQGSMIFASSNHRGDRLGEFLVRSGRMTQSHLELASRRVKETGLRLGASMVALGLMTESEMLERVHEQVRAIIYSMFAWERGEYRFVENEHPIAEELALQLPTVPIILEGVRRLHNPVTVRRALGDLKAIVRHAKDPCLVTSGVRLTPQEGFVLSRVDGHSTIGNILALSPLGDDQTLRCLYGLFAAGFLEFGKSHELTPSRRPGQRVPSRSPVPETPRESQGVPESSSRERRTRDDVLARHSALSTGTYYDLLGVRRSADTDEIKNSYLSIVKVYHPDRLRSAGLRDLQGHLADIIAKANEAWQVLSDPVARGRYDSSLRTEAPRGELSQTSISPPRRCQKDDTAAEAKTVRELLLEAKRSFAAEDFHKTIALMQEAVRLDSSSAPCHRLLAQALARNPRWRKDAEEHFSAALRVNPCDVASLLGLGELYQAEGMTSRAERLFAQALGLDPDNEKLKERILGNARRLGGKDQALWSRLIPRGRH